MLRRTRRAGEAPPEDPAPPAGDDLASLLQALLPPGAPAAPDLLDRLRSCVHPALYLAQCTPAERDLLGADPGVDEVLAHWLRTGAERRVCALFHPQWYADRLAELGEPAPQRPFLHWLTVGWERRIVPTPLFDEDFYARRHPHVATQLRSQRRWGFAHYLTTGCYQPQWTPSPLGRHHPGGDPARDPASAAPLLVRELLHRADEHDLARTSWLEEGCVAALRRLAALRSPRMRELVARAAALEPRILPLDDVAPVIVPPHRSRRLYLCQQAETVRRQVGVTRADTVVLVAGLDADPGNLGRTLADTLATRTGGTAVVVGTDVPATAAGSGVPSYDLTAPAAGLDDDQRLDLLLDLVRGLVPGRVVVAGSELGWSLVAAFGRQLSAEASLGACLGSPVEPTERAEAHFHDCFEHLDWALVPDDLRRGLVHRYALPQTAARRLLDVRDPDAAATAALALPRRRP